MFSNSFTIEVNVLIGLVMATLPDLTNSRIPNGSSSLNNFCVSVIENRLVSFLVDSNISKELFFFSFLETEDPTIPLLPSTKTFNKTPLNTFNVYIINYLFFIF